MNFETGPDCMAVDSKSVRSGEKAFHFDERRSGCSHAGLIKENSWIKEPSYSFCEQRGAVVFLATPAGVPRAVRPVKNLWSGESGC